MMKFANAVSILLASIFLTAQAVLDTDHLAQNTAVYAGDEVIISCRGADVPGPPPRIQWYEYAYNSNGNLISDGEFISPAHPHNARYRLVMVEHMQYDLHITTTISTDGGTYVCTDANAGLGQKFRHAAQLIIIAGRQECTTTLPGSGILIEGNYHTTECVTRYTGNIAPNMLWFGPGPITQGQSTTPTMVWNGKSIVAAKSMHLGQWQSLANFTDRFLPVPADTADNIPDFEESYYTQAYSVYWPPQSMSAGPLTQYNEYPPGYEIECFADANPAATFLWQNTRTGERFESKTFTVQGSWLGYTQLMRCSASNVVDLQDIAILVTVVAPTSITTPTTPTTVLTTAPPPVSKCGDISGYWVSNNPSLAHLCIDVDIPSIGNVHGVLRTGYEVFWFDLIGQTNLPDFDHTSWTAIWPLNRAVTTFIGECSRCFGEEILLVNAVSRSKGTGTCGIPGVITYTEQYEFRRSPGIQCPPITIPT